MPPKASPSRSRAPKGERTDVLAQALRAREREVIESYLREHHGNVSATAEALGISRRALDYKLDEHGMRDEGARLREVHGITGRRGS